MENVTNSLKYLNSQTIKHFFINIFIRRKHVCFGAIHLSMGYQHQKLHQSQLWYMQIKLVTIPGKTNTKVNSFTCMCAVKNIYKYKDAYIIIAACKASCVPHQLKLTAMQRCQIILCLTLVSSTIRETDYINQTVKFRILYTATFFF